MTVDAPHLAEHDNVFKTHFRFTYENGSASGHDVPDFVVLVKFMFLSSCLVLVQAGNAQSSADCHLPDDRGIAVNREKETLILVC